MRRATGATVCYPPRVRLEGFVLAEALVLLVGGCSSIAGVHEMPTDASSGNADGAPPLYDDGGPRSIPPHVFGVHMAHLQAFEIDDVRLCPSNDDAGARPNANTVPRTNYAGIARGGFAELENPGTWMAPFAVDAYGLGMAEGTIPIPCETLDGNNLYKKVRLKAVTLVKPGLVALLDVQDAGPEAGAEVRTVPMAQMTMVPAYQVVNLSPDLVSPNLVVRAGPLDGQCTPMGELYEGAGTYVAALAGPAAFPSPNANAFDTEGIQVCVGQSPQLVFSQSWADLQAASIPETVPSEFYGKKALYAIVLMGARGATDPADRLHAVIIPFDVTK